MWKAHCVLALLVLCSGTAHSWDIVLSKGDQLVFYTNGTTTATVHLSSHNLAALAYDDVHNLILYVDRQSNNDAIGGYSLTTMESKYFTEGYGRNIQGIAFDPATEKLFFTDTNERSINWISLKPGSQNNDHVNRIVKMEAGIPTDIAVDSCRGYIYWITTNLTTPKIERARFDGSEREVVINSNAFSVSATQKLEPHSLIIDQQTQTMFWFEATNTIRHSNRRADLNGQNNVEHSYFTMPSLSKIFSNKSNVLTVSKNSLISWAWCEDCSVWEERKYVNVIKPTKMVTLHCQMPVGIAAHYKIEQQIQGLNDCEALKSVVPNDRLGPFCVHGKTVNGQSPCKCSPGYIGERCDVSVCENYCLQGNCSYNDVGLPTCSCNDGYSGERCDVYVCQDYCLNNGDCSLNENNKPVCECRGDYVGDRCEISDCLNYCIQGNCSFNDDGLRACSCNDGYSGERCDVYACQGYCLNNGDCSLNENNEPVCECRGDYVGGRCEVSDCLNYCIQGNCSFNDDGLRACSCNDGYSGERCDVYACQGYCLNNGDCSLNENNEPVCECRGDYVGGRCEVSDCLNYCIQGNCSFNDDGLRACSCNDGYSGERCEVNVCHGYCSNNGSCSLNENSEPVCECRGDYVGDRCEVSDCLNYCNQGNCSLIDVGLPICSCNAGYIGERCEVNVCHGYCLNNGECTLTEEDEPICQCVGNYEGSRCEAYQRNNFVTIPSCDFADRKLTLAYLLLKCHNYCLQGTCHYNEEGFPVCSCYAGYSGKRCEASKRVMVRV